MNPDTKTLVDYILFWTSEFTANNGCWPTQKRWSNAEVKEVLRAAALRVREADNANP